MHTIKTKRKFWQDMCQGKGKKMSGSIHTLLDNMRENTKTIIALNKISDFELTLEVWA